MSSELSCFPKASYISGCAPHIAINFDLRLINWLSAFPYFFFPCTTHFTLSLQGHRALSSELLLGHQVALLPRASNYWIKFGPFFILRFKKKNRLYRICIKKIIHILRFFVVLVTVGEIKSLIQMSAFPTWPHETE